MVEMSSVGTAANPIGLIAALLGGDRVLRRHLETPLDAHEMLVTGLPGEALLHLVESFEILRRRVVFEQATGISLRTIQRRRGTPIQMLSREQSGRTWKLAEVLARATSLLGSREAAEQWLERPAMGLDQRRPIDLLSTPAGMALVEAFLERLEYGVYT
ncbi:type II RES/Xre toxin-antitoxin system antitoxin [Rhodopila sp.]|uniref:type II RES/Xre toxin-antitoxin system antitoxin n=1 Tax=Rhodopila sp. TaxID=2480087 RepID=UPI003D0B1F66